MQKARRHPEGLRPLVSIWFQDLFHPFIQSAFHLSLTVLVHYRSLRSIQPYQMVLADSDRITHVPPYSGYCQVYKLFRLRDYHPLWSNFPDGSSIIYNSITQSYNPNLAETKLVWAVSRSLATTREIIIIFSSSGYLDVSVPRVCVFRRLVFNQPGCPIQKSTGQKLFAPNRSLSQLITSFIASESQGIHHMPLVTY